MSIVLLPRPRLALRQPAVRAALVVAIAGPLLVGLVGKDADAPIRLRLVGLAIAAVVALSWDDRAHTLTASTPVGLPAVRRGRTLVVVAILTVGWGLACLAVPDTQSVPLAALALQMVVLSTLALAIVGWFGRDGDNVLAVPVPALLVSIAVLNRLPAEVALMRADPSTSAWPDERTRWWVLLVIVAVAVLRLQRDPAAR